MKNVKVNVDCLRGYSYKVNEFRREGNEIAECVIKDNKNQVVAVAKFAMPADVDIEDAYVSTKDFNNPSIATAKVTVPVTTSLENEYIPTKIFGGYGKVKAEGIQKGLGGPKVGTWKFYRNNGTLYKVANYNLDSKLDGIVIYYRGDGKTIDVMLEYKNGVKLGRTSLKEQRKKGLGNFNTTSYSGNVTAFLQRL